MDLDMYQHPATQRNLQILQSFGNIIIEPESGELASGLIGKGRMAEPEQIVTFVTDYSPNARTSRENECWLRLDLLTRR